MVKLKTKVRIVTEVSTPVVTTPKVKGHLSVVPDPPPAPKVVKTDGRNPNYLGPGLDIEPEDLAKYEAKGKHVAMPKIDGMWSECRVGCPAEGRPNVLSSRDAATAAISGSNLGDLGNVALPWPEGTLIVGELEAATQWAKDITDAKGYRTFHAWDVLDIGDNSARGLPWHKRRDLLQQMYAMGLTDDAQSRFELLDAKPSGFQQLYDATCQDGGEGIVLWDANSLYSTHRADGKTDLMIRCKRWLTGDYVLWKLGTTPSGVLTGEWGLMKGGKLTRTMKATCPAEYLIEENVGKLVCEFKGWAKFKSGALRHASFVRVRTDKAPESCTL